MESLFLLLLLFAGYDSKFFPVLKIEKKQTDGGFSLKKKKYLRVRSPFLSLEARKYHYNKIRLYIILL